MRQKVPASIPLILKIPLAESILKKYSSTVFMCKQRARASSARRCPYGVHKGTQDRYERVRQKRTRRNRKKSEKKKEEKKNIDIQ